MAVNSRPTKISKGRKAAIALPWVLVGALLLATSDPLWLSAAIGLALAIALAVAAKRRWIPDLGVPRVLRRRSVQSAAAAVAVALPVAGYYLDIAPTHLAGNLLIMVAVIPLVADATKPWRDDRRHRLRPDHGQRLRRRQ